MKTGLLLKAGLGPLLESCPLTGVDVGSRGGFEPDLLPIAGAVDAVCFEPEPAAFAEMERQPCGPWRSLRLLPHALAGSEGERLLHVPEGPEGSSLLPHDLAIGEIFGMQHLFRPSTTVTVRTHLLDRVVDEAGLPPPTYLKLDVEGAELEILQSSPATLGNLLAVKTEISFIPFRHGQPLAGDVEALLRARGFELMDLIAPHRWRVEGDVVHPQAARQAVPYSRGQLVAGDFLFFRRPDAIEEPAARLRAAALAMAYGYFDHAGRLLLEPATSAWLKRIHGCDARALLGRCSRAYGRAVWRKEFLRHLRATVTFARSLRALWTVPPS